MDAAHGRGHGGAFVLLHARNERPRVVRHLGHGPRVWALGIHGARRLDDVLVVEERQNAAIGHVERNDRAGVASNRRDGHEGDLVVAAQLSPIGLDARGGAAGFELHVTGITRGEVLLVARHGIDGAAGQVLEELVGQCRHDLPAAGPRLPQMRKRHLGTVVVVEVFGGQQPQRTQSLAFEERRAVRGLESGVVVPQACHLRLALEIHLAQPTQVIESEVVVLARGRRQAQRVRRVLVRFGGRVADADDARVGVLVHGLRHHAHRITEVHKPRLGRQS